MKVFFFPTGHLTGCFTGHCTGHFTGTILKGTPLEPILHFQSEIVDFITWPNGDGFCFNMSHLEADNNRHFSRVTSSRFINPLIGPLPPSISSTHFPTFGFLVSLETCLPIIIN